MSYYLPRAVSNLAHSSGNRSLLIWSHLISVRPTSPKTATSSCRRLVTHFFTSNSKFVSKILPTSNQEIVTADSLPVLLPDSFSTWSCRTGSSLLTNRRLVSSVQWSDIRVPLMPNWRHWAILYSKILNKDISNTSHKWNLYLEAISKITDFEINQFVPIFSAIWVNRHWVP